MTTKSMTIRMVDTITQYQKIKSEVDEAVAEVVASGAYINGPAVKSFTANLVSYLNAKHVIPCGNGTDALQIALMALGLEPGDEVITPTFTFVSTGEVVALLGMKPVFVDVDIHTFNMDPASIEAAITPKTKCIVPVHLFGQPANMDAIMEIAKRHNLYVVEDNAQAIGSQYTFADGTTQMSGMIGDIGTTSFYPSKNLGAFGDGGAIFTQNDEIDNRIQSICNHGMKVRYLYDRVGVNSRLDSVQAAILDVKLKHLDTYNTARRTAADMYDERFATLEGVLTPVRDPNSTHVFHQYTIRIQEGRERRDQIHQYFMDQKVPAGIYYPVCLHEQECYEIFGVKKGDLPVAEQLSGEVMSLPMHSEMNEAQIDYIFSVFKEAINQ